jgi:myo-inositol 2-dehydrogenase/D-chiro-inositol 1-dehydrogenase
VALFGLGRAGQFHLNNISRHPRATLLYVIDEDKKKADEVASNYTCVGLTSGEEALNDPRVNAVIIATPTPTHFDLIIKAVNAGKAIFAEKPIGVSLKEIDEAYEAAKIKNIPFLCGFNRRFDPSWVKVCEAVHSGQIGKPQIARTTARDSPCPTVEYLLTSHGFFHDAGVHDIDVLRWVLGEEPLSVYALTKAHLPYVASIGDVDTILMTFEFPSGCVGTIDLSRKAVYGYDQRLEIFGDKGMAQVENKPSTSCVLSTANGELHDNIMFSFPQRFEQAYYIEFDHFVRIVLEGEQPKLLHIDSRNVFIIAEAAKQSAKTGLPVKIDYSQK